MLIGDLGVGKSCVILRFIENDFNSNLMSSIGVDFKMKNTEIDSQLVKLQIWDTAGHEKFRTITTSYYKSAQAIIVIYDITNEQSFEHIKNWMVEIDKFAKQGVLRVIVGNKTDLEESRVVQKDKGESLAQEFGIKFFEVSAKNGNGIQELFEGIGKELLEKRGSNDGGGVNNFFGGSVGGNNNLVLSSNDFTFGHKKQRCCK